MWKTEEIRKIIAGKIICWVLHVTSLSHYPTMLLPSCILVSFSSSLFREISPVLQHAVHNQIQVYYTFVCSLLCHHMIARKMRQGSNSKHLLFGTDTNFDVYCTVTKLAKSASAFCSCPDARAIMASCLYPAFADLAKQADPETDFCLKIEAFSALRRSVQHLRVSTRTPACWRVSFVRSINYIDYILYLSVRSFSAGSK
jgi:hypothetical protein